MVVGMGIGLADAQLSTAGGREWLAHHQRTGQRLSLGQTVNDLVFPDFHNSTLAIWNVQT